MRRAPILFRGEPIVTARDSVAAAPWMFAAACRGRGELFFARAGERPEVRERREAEARALCSVCPVLGPCSEWAREHREYGFWGGESEEERAAAGYRVDMPVGQVARYPRGQGKPVSPRPGAPLQSRRRHWWC